MRITLRLSDHVTERLAFATRRPGSSKSAIVEEALDRHFNAERTSGDASLIRRLDQMSRSIGRLASNGDIVLETLALFIRYYLTITPPLPASDQDAARALGRDRFEIFIAQIGKRLASGSKLATAVMERAAVTNPDLFAEGVAEPEPLASQQAEPATAELRGENAEERQPAAAETGGSHV